MAKGEGAGKGSRAGGQENGVPHLDGARKELLQELARREGTPLSDRAVYFRENPANEYDTGDPWQFKNFLFVQ